MNGRSPQLVKASQVLTSVLTARQGDPWSFEALAGSLVELSEEQPCGAATFASELLAAAQRRGEPAAWVTGQASLFFPPDFAGNGIDLASIAVVAGANERDALWAADLLARSGAFGFIVIDFGSGARVADGAMARLVHLAQRHRAVILFLTMKGRSAPSLSSLVAVHAVVRPPRAGRGAHASRDRPGAEAERLHASTARAAAARTAVADPEIGIEVTIVKDKRRAPGLTIRRSYGTPLGMR